MASSGINNCRDLIPYVPINFSKIGVRCLSTKTILSKVIFLSVSYKLLRSFGQFFWELFFLEKVFLHKENGFLGFSFQEMVAKSNVDWHFREKHSRSCYELCKLITVIRFK